MGTREDCPTVSSSGKKGKIPLQTYITTAEDLKEASELIVILDEMLQKNHANLKFEPLLLWWLASEPVEA